MDSDDQGKSGRKVGLCICRYLERLGLGGWVVLLGGGH